MGICIFRALSFQMNGSERGPFVEKVQVRRKDTRGCVDQTHFRSQGGSPNECLVDRLPSLVSPARTSDVLERAQFCGEARYCCASICFIIRCRQTERAEEEDEFYKGGSVCSMTIRESRDRLIFASRIFTSIIQCPPTIFIENVSQVHLHYEKVDVASRLKV